MFGISTSTKESIARVVSDLFDKVALRFVGDVPKLRNKKAMLVGFEETPTLANLFIQTMNNRYPNSIEQDVLKGLLDGAHSFIDILKAKTANSITDRLEAMAREARINKTKIPEAEVSKIIEEELSKAKSGLNTIIMSEGTKTRNLGMTMDITRAAAADGVSDPIVGFAVIKDKSTCPVCIKVNLMPDGITPRLFRLSELSAGYYKRGETVPSILGQHPHCRCTIFTVPSDWGFNKKGHITFIGLGHDELEKQRTG